MSGLEVQLSACAYGSMRRSRHKCIAPEHSSQPLLSGSLLAARQRSVFHYCTLNVLLARPDCRQQRSRAGCVAGLGGIAGRQGSPHARRSQQQLQAVRYAAPSGV